MEDYLSEKEQWEWLKAQLRENAPAALAAVVVVLAGLGGWRWWQQHQDAARLAAGTRYIGMVQALEHGDRSQALVLLGELERSAPASPYTDQAKLLAARVYVDGNELDKAARELAAVASGSKDQNLALIARERLARVQIAQHQPDAALSTLKDAPPPSFARRFHEVRGDAYFAKGDRVAALREYRAAKSGASPGATPLLDLKIADLGGAATAPAAAAK